MKSLNIDTVNFKRLLINGKEFYSTTGRTILNTNFLGDESITFPASSFADGVYNYSRSEFEDPIRKYRIETADSLTTIAVTKVDVIHFSITSTLDQLRAVTYIGIGTVPYYIKFRDYSAGVWTYTLDRNCTSAYTSVVPVHTISAIDKDDANLTPSLIKIDTNVKVYYKDVYTNDDSIRNLTLKSDSYAYGQVGQFNFDGNLNNSYGGTGTGTGTYTYTTSVSGINSSGSSLINLGNLHGSSDGITISGWFRWNGANNTVALSCNGINFWVKSSTVWGLGTNNSDVYGPTYTLVAGNWYQFIFTFETNKYGVLYINGVKQSLSQKQSTRTNRTPANANITLFLNGYNNFGAIDTLKIFNRVLSDAEMVQLYQSSSSSPVDSVTVDMFTQRNINKLSNVTWSTLQNDYKINVENAKIVADGSILIENQIIELDTSIIEITNN